MIHILFVPGMFGSTIEHVLRSYTKEYTPTGGVIDKFGALHTFTKEFHPTDGSKIYKHLDKLTEDSITTPIYPFIDSRLPDILKEFDNIFNSQHKCMLLHAPNREAAEINMLFQYHKIVLGLEKSLDAFYSGIKNSNFKRWNKSYQSWADLKPWEFREWFSLFYVEWIQEWIDSKNQVANYFLKISNVDVLTDPESQFKKIINFCELTEVPGLTDFCTKWKQAQQYIVDEFESINKIISAVTSQQSLTWQPMSIISEAIVQRRLRDAGYEIKCANLDIFPNDSKTLYNLLEKV